MSAPLAVAPLAALWAPSAPVAAPSLTPSDLVGGDVVWLMHLGVAAAAAEPAPAPIGMLGGAPLADPARPADLVTATPVLRYSDRGWIGEETDAAAPNVIYPARMIEPPALEYAVPVRPEGARRRAFVAGEIMLANGDGTLDSLAGNWSVGGQTVTILRGPHTRPRHAALSSFLTVAILRAGGPASGTTRLRLPMLDASGDLGVPVSALYGGTGGADGDADLEGQPKPMLYGIKRRFEPVQINAATSIYQIHDGVISAVLAVRDRGADYAFEADVANYAALAATAPASGCYRTCLAAGLVRVEPSGASVSLLTVDARGDVGTGYSAGTPASIARKLLAGPGGLSSAQVAADAFGAWPVGEAGLLLRGGTVAQAMDVLAAGVAGWWGPDRLGRITGGQIEAPEALSPAWDVSTPMLRAPPEEAEAAAPPRWRVTIGYQVPGRILDGEDLAGSVSAADRAAWGREYQSAVSADLATQAAYRQSEDAEPLPSVFDAEADAAALALRLREMHGVPRRTWRAALNRSGLAVQPGDAVRLTWPRHGLSGGKVLIVRAVSVRGDRTDVLLWG